MYSFKAKQSNFTLVELIAVLAIALLVAGMVTVGAIRRPAHVTLKNASASLMELLGNARSQALLQNKKVFVSFDQKRKTFAITGESTESKDKKASSAQKTLPDEVEVEFPVKAEKLKWIYCFYPDGTGSGPDTVLSIKQHNLRVAVSPLTGMAFCREADND